MMGMFNLFIVLPQIAASSLLGGILKHFLHNEPMNALVVGGASMGLAALLTLLVVSFKGHGGELPAGVGGSALARIQAKGGAGDSPAPVGGPQTLERKGATLRKGSVDCHEALSPFRPAGRRTVPAGRYRFRSRRIFVRLGICHRQLLILCP